MQVVDGFRLEYASSAASKSQVVAKLPGASERRRDAQAATESGIEVVAPVHDALMICAPLDRLDADVEQTRAAMTKASSIVLNGFELGADAHVVRYPDRYMDERGAVMWQRVMALLEQAERFDEAA
jgi:DNA polymerase-1